MVFQLFGFIFKIIGSYFDVIINKFMLTENVSVGMFLIGAFLIFFVLGKILGIISRELSDFESDSYEYGKAVYSNTLRLHGVKHARNFPRHAKK